MSEPRLRCNADLDAPLTVTLPGEFTLCALQRLYDQISNEYKPGTTLTLDGLSVEQTDAAGVQFLLACRSLPGGHEDATPLRLLASEPLRRAIDMLGAAGMLSRCLLEPAPPGQIQDDDSAQVSAA